MPKKRGYKKPQRKTRLPVKKQIPWKQMAGIASSAIDAAGSIPGPVGLVARGLSMVKKLVNVECKTNTVAPGALGVVSTGVVTPLTLLAQGVTDVTRIGNSILSKRISIRGYVDQNASATATRYRIMLILDKDNAQGTAPTPAQILQNLTPNSHLNLNSTDRFVVLHSERGALSINGERTRLFEIQKDLSNLHIKYDGTAADQASAAENHLYLFAISDEATNNPSYTFESRFCFYDN